MNFNLILPNCVICDVGVMFFRHEPKGDRGPLQRLEFQCGAMFVREGKPDFKNDWLPYGPWSAWKCTVQCSNATDVALKLLEQAKKQ